MYKHAHAGVVVGQSGIEATYDSVLNPGLPPAHLRVDSMGRIAGPLQRNDVRSPPTLQLTIDAHLQRAAEKAVQDGIALARKNGRNPTGGSAVVMNPQTGADLCARELAELQPGARSPRSVVSRPSLPRPLAPTRQSRDRRRLSDGLDVQADRRGGWAQHRDHHVLDAASVQRVVRPRRHDLQERRGGRVLDHVPADRARRVVRHVVLPAR